nr:transmembrane protein 144 [Hymenolepis microstoma]
MQPFYTSAMALALIPIEWGYIAIFALTLAFGTMYIPTKKYDIGNGMIFQWLMCTSLGFCLFAIHVCFGSQRIWSLTLLSGILWSTANVAVVPIIRRLGMGVGMLIWSMVNLLMGWASSRFGWFGIKPEEPKNSTLNIIGVVFATLSVVVYAFITPFSTGQAPQHMSTANSDDIVVSRGSEPNATESTGDSDPLLQVQVSPIQRFWKSQIAQRLIGVILSILSGLLFGLVFVPIIYVQENYAMASKRGIDYTASIGMGAFLASTTYLILYFLILQLKGQITVFFRDSEVSPSTEPNVGTTPFKVLFLPAMLAGALCAIGQACWLVANEALQASITFPIAATLPGALATLLGTLFYREVHGTGNYIKLAVALTLTLLGSLLTGLSK